MKYKIVKKAEPGVSGGGTPKYYAFPHYSGEIDIFALSKKLAIRSTLTQIDCFAVLMGMTNLVAEELLEGNIVRLGTIGTFRISLSSEASQTVEDISATSIKKSRVLFRPSQVFRGNLSGLKFEKAKDVSANPIEDEVEPAA